MAETMVTCVDVEGQEYEVPTSELVWRPSAYGIVIKDQALLLSAQFGGYDLPGGGVDLGEPLETTVVREVKEETGIDVANPKFLGFERSFFKLPGEREHPFADCLMYYYECDFVGGEISAQGFDTHERDYADLAEWVPLKDLDEVKLISTIDCRQYIRMARGSS